jgi:hypothetical protein
MFICILPARLSRCSLKLASKLARGVMPKRGEINVAGMAELIALLGAAGGIGKPLPPVQRFVDLQYLHAVGLR